MRLAYAGIFVPDPAPLRGPHSEMLLREVYSGLTEIDDDGQPTGALAESYSVRDDGTTYVFTLRNGLKFSDGTDITAADFAWSWARALSPKFSEGMARHVLERNPLYWGDPPKIDALVFDSPVEIAAVAHWDPVEWDPADELLPEGNRCSPGGASTGYRELGSESPPSFDDARLDVRQSLTYFRDQSEVPEHFPRATSFWDTELNLELQVLEVSQERRARAISRFEPPRFWVFATQL